MSYTAVASLKGSPGATTVAYAIARILAAGGHETILVDADRFGGSIGPVLGLPGLPSIRNMAQATRRQPNPDAVPGFVQQVEANLGVIVGITSLEQSVALSEMWPNVAATLAETGPATVIVDIGRIPESHSGAGSMVKMASRLIVVTRADRQSAVFLSSWSQVLRGLGHEIEVVLSQATPREVANMTEATDLPVVAALPTLRSGGFCDSGYAGLPGRGEFANAIGLLAGRAIQPANAVLAKAGADKGESL
ncbi:MAG: hypothetical protein ACYCST_04575 [Acidimicrobiales bacterium]